MNFPLTTELEKSTSDEGLKKELQYLLKLAKNALATMTEIIGTIFIKTTTVIAGVIPAKNATIKSLLADFKKAANDRGITNVSIDDDITGWFPKEKIGTTAGPARLLRFANTITHAKIIEGCKQLQAYQEFDLSDGIQRATALVAAGELDEKNNRGIIIYLTNKYDGISCRLGVWRDGDGKLHLYVNRVGPGGGWGAGGGVLSGNEPLD